VTRDQVWRIGLAACGFLAIAACGPGGAAAGTNDAPDSAAHGAGSGAPFGAREPIVWTTTRSVQVMAEAMVAGIDSGGLEVRCALPDGVAPDHWRPDRPVIERLLRGERIVLHGAGLEEWAGQVALPPSRVIDCGRPLRGRLLLRDEVTHTHGQAGEHTHRGVDPFVALDPELVRLQGQVLAEALAALVPRQERALRANHAAWDAAVAAAAAPWQARAARDPQRPWFGIGRAYDYLGRALDREICDLGELDDHGGLGADGLQRLDEVLNGAAGGAGPNPGGVLFVPRPLDAAYGVALAAQCAARDVRVAVLDPRVGAADPARFVAALDGW